MASLNAEARIPWRQKYNRIRRGVCYHVAIEANVKSSDQCARVQLNGECAPGENLRHYFGIE